MSAKQSAARLKMLREPGYLYAARSRYCDWIKVGFTGKGPRERLEAINSQYREFAPFSMMGALRSTWDAEQQLHHLLEPFRQRRTGRTKELYPAVPSLVAAVEKIISNPDWLPLEWEARRAVWRWAYDAAAHPTNRDQALEAFERYRQERHSSALCRAVT